MNVLLNQWDKHSKKHINEEDKQNLKQLNLNDTTQTIISKTDPLRSQITQFYAEKQISTPKKALHVRGTVPQVIPLMNLYNVEMIQIKNFLELGQKKKARKKSLILWKSIENRTGRPCYIVSHMINLYIINQLTKFHSRHPELRQLFNGSNLSRLIQSTLNNLVTRTKRSFACEYRSMVSILDMLRNNPKELHNVFSLTNDQLSPIVRVFKSTWPMFDYWKTRRTLHDWYFELWKLLGEPYHQIRGKLHETDQRIQSKIERWSRPGISHVENPVGKITLAASFPNIFDIVFDTAKARSKLKMTKWIQNTEPDFEPTSIPMDELSGEHYKIKTTSDSVLVRSTYDESEHYQVPISLTFKR